MYVKENAKLSPNLILKSGVETICNTPLYPPVAGTELLSFCSSNLQGGYRPDYRDLKVREEQNELQNSKGVIYIPASYRLNLFPNPASSKLNLRFSIPESTTLKLSISNMLGVSLIVPIDKENHPSGEFSIPVDVSGLSPGVYFCTMQSSLGIITKSFVVIK